ncbi:hypothetical protein ACJX0J_033568, partial [Zea mays]
MARGEGTIALIVETQQNVAQTKLTVSDDIKLYQIYNQPQTQIRPLPQSYNTQYHDVTINQLTFGTNLHGPILIRTKNKVNETQASKNKMSRILASTYLITS